MGQATDEFVAVIRETGKGSDYLGACECCGKGGADFKAAGWKRIYRKEDGRRYIGGGVDIYGHHDCLSARFPNLIPRESMPKEKNIYLMPASLG